MHHLVPKIIYFKNNLEEFLVRTNHKEIAIKGTLRTISFSGKLSYLVSYHGIKR